MSLLLLERACHRDPYQFEGLLEVSAHCIWRRRRIGSRGGAIGRNEFVAEVQIRGRVPGGLVSGRVICKLQLGQMFVQVTMTAPYVLRDHRLKRTICSLDRVAVRSVYRRKFVANIICCEPPFELA